MSILSSLIFSFLSILCVVSLPNQRFIYDITCSAKGGVLCLKEELLIIATIAEAIGEKSMEIEKNIQQIKTLPPLNKFIDVEMNYTRFYVPKSPYHKDFFLRNNIDKKYLTNLVIEAHNAMIFFYNSINDLLNLESMYGEKNDEWFNKILNNIKDDIICRYRNVLDVFSLKWKSIYSIGRIHFSRRHQLSPSNLYNLHSLVIARYIKEWMKQINEVINDLPMKYFPN